MRAGSHRSYSLGPLAVAVAALGVAVRLHQTRWHGTAAVVLLAVALAAIVAATIPWPARLRAVRPSRLLLAAALLVGLAVHLAYPPVLVASLNPGASGRIAACVGIATIAAVIGLFAPRRGMAAAVALGGVLVCGGLAWVWTFAATTRVYSDVVAWHDEASSALLGGHNPYAIDMPNVYGPETTVYARDMLRGDRVRTGYPYPPLPLALTAGSYALGDARLGMCAAGIVAAALIAACGPTRYTTTTTTTTTTTAAGATTTTATAAAGLLLLAPHAFYVPPLGYTDVYVALALALAVWCAARWPRLLPLALGLLLASKQYAVMLLPAFVLLVREPLTIRSAWRLLWPAVLVAALLTLPPLLWDAAGYVRSVLLFQVRQPYRADSLGFLPGLSRWGVVPGSWLGFVTWALASAWVWWRCPASPGGFALGVALLASAFFMFNKQAFENYYFVVTAALCCAVACAADTTATATTAAAAAASGSRAARQERRDGT